MKLAYALGLEVEIKQATAAVFSMEQTKVNFEALAPWTFRSKNTSALHRISRGGKNPQAQAMACIV